MQRPTAAQVPAVCLRGVWRVRACHFPGDLMASEGLAEALATVLGGQGLLVQNCDSEPAGKPLSPVRLRKNVCYVVLAVFLNEQVSVRPPAFRWSAPPALEGTGEPTAAAREWSFPVLQSTLTLAADQRSSL